MDAGVITSIVGTALTLLALAVGLGRVLQSQAEVVRRLTNVESRLDRVDSTVSDLRVDVAKVGQQVVDHLGDQRAHAGRR